MQSWQIIILAFSGLGIFNSLAFVVYLHITKNSSFYKNIFLQVILLAFVLQITKALIELFQWNFSPYIPNLYLLGVYMQGPAMYMFIRKTLNPQFSTWPKQFIVHFLPYIMISLVKYDFDNNGAKEWIVIYLVGIQSLSYIILCIKPYLKARKLFLQKNKQYYMIVYLFPFFAIQWITFPIAGITKIDYQILETLFHSAFVYYLMFLKIKEPVNEKDKYKFSGIDVSASLELYQKVTDQIINKEYYLNPDITLSTLAKKVNLQVNILSQIINQNSNLNFRDFLNTFRIEKAKKELLEKTNKGFTISSVAFDCGFNSLSAFNRAFKKVSGVTPSEYLKLIPNI